ncbi:MAG TPA: hypothetical protein VJ600_05850 [Holophagaceae bacterium]|nr:hypothetical protein [Holophagaceae bacterium]
MTKPLVPADLLKNLDKAQKAEDAGGAKAAPKPKAGPAPAVRVSTKPAGKAGGAAHTRMSNRGK